MFGVLTALRAIADVPAKDAGCADHEDGEEVEERGLKTGCGVLVCDCWWIGGFWRVEEGNYRREVRDRYFGPHAWSAFSIIIGCCEEACSFGGLTHGGGLGRDDLVPPGEAPVVEALAQKNNVCYCVVDGKNDLDRCQYLVM